MIPRIIHQTWKTTDLLPHMKQSQDSFIRLNPGWTYILWTDKMNRDLVKKYFSWFIEYYDNYEYNIQRADVIRYFILWLYGGVYTDTDIICKRPLDDLHKELEESGQDLGIIHSSHLDYYSNWFMISSKKNPFWPKVWDQLVDVYGYKKCMYCITRHLKIMMTTGPIFIDRCMKKYKPPVRDLTAGFNDCSVCDTHCVCDNCYIVNMNAGQWNSWDSKLMNQLLCKWQYMVLLLLMVLVMLIIIHPCKRHAVS